MFTFLKKKEGLITTIKEAFAKYAMPILVILLLFNTIQIGRFSSTVKTVDRYKEGLVDELGGFRNDISNFGGNLNEIRQYLLLPTQDYSFLEEENPDDTNGTESSKTEKALYRYVGSLVSEQKIASNKQKVLASIIALQKDATLISELKAYELSIGQLEEDEEQTSFKIFRGKAKYFRVLAEHKQGTLSINDIISGNQKVQTETLELQRQEVIDYTIGKIEEIETTVAKEQSNLSLVENTMNETEIAELISQKKLIYSAHTEEGRFEIMNADNVTLLKILIKQSDGNININGQVVSEPNSLKALLVSAISQLNETTSSGKLVEQRRKELEGVIQEEAFSDLLKELGFNVTQAPREEYNKLLYDVSNSENHLQFSFVIELSSGLIKILKNDQEIDLFSILSETAKKKL